MDLAFLEDCDKLRTSQPSKVKNIMASSGSGNVEVQFEEDQICWVCLDRAQPNKSLIKPCKCPRFCHAACIARWQLQSAGTRRETNCDFCNSNLPDWKAALTPVCGTNVSATMNVNFDGKMYSFEVQPGPSGYRKFTEDIRKAFSLPKDSDLNITFTCDEPLDVFSGSLLILQGPGAYDAAVHCAAVSAARRMAMTSQNDRTNVGNVEENNVSSASHRKGKGFGTFGLRLKSAIHDFFGVSNSQPLTGC